MQKHLWKLISAWWLCLKSCLWLHRFILDKLSVFLVVFGRDRRSLLLVTMSRQSQLFTLLRRRFHSPSSSDAPTETLRKRITDLQKSKKRRNPIKNQFLVEVPESRSYLDTATMPMFLAVVGIALFAKVLMMVTSFYYYLSLWICLSCQITYWSVMLILHCWFVARLMIRNRKKWLNGR